ncbi:phosphotransferase [Streptomyces sp. NPDC047000]|uniref:phosphotransferase n=1 Tax=Streptomyces sp. NPDC047000 TaxID=3155474 RepID=UPI0034107E7C
MDQDADSEGLLTREADALELLATTEIPVARLHGLDASAEFCDHPSLLMSWLPGTGGRRGIRHGQVRVPGGALDPEVGERAGEVIRRPAPEYRGCFLHRDFHPGNVLLSGEGSRLAITGFVDWVETSWGPWWGCLLRRNSGGAPSLGEREPRVEVVRIRRRW